LTAGVRESGERGKRRGIERGKKEVEEENHLAFYYEYIRILYLTPKLKVHPRLYKVVITVTDK